MSEQAGILYSIEEANEKFGRVISSTNLSVSELNTLINQTSNYIMFKLVDEEVIVLNNERVAIYPAGYPVQEQAVFTLYSSSIINELIAQELVTEVSIEQRAEVISLTCGNLTLETGTPCPPYCDVSNE